MNAHGFTDAEMETLRRGATGAGLLVAVSDRSFIDTFKEAGALAKHLRAARAGSASPLIRELAEGGGLGFGLTDSPAEVEAGTLAALRSSAQLLERKAPDEFEAYRSFVLEVARSVSAAAGGGDEAEKETIEKINAELGEGSP